MAYALGSLVTIASVTVALPWVLVHVAGSPLPSHLPAWDELVMVLSRPDDGTLLLAALKYLTWIAWAVFVLLLIAEATARLRRKPTPRIPGLHGPQQLAALLLTGIGAFIVGTTTSYGRPATLPAVTPAAALATGPSHLDHGHSDHEPPPASPAHGKQPTIVTVKPGESLWAIARNQLPDGASNARIAELVDSTYRENRALRQPDGTRLEDPDLLQPGWKLRIPAVAETHRRNESPKPRRPKQHEHRSERPSHPPTPSAAPTTEPRTNPPHSAPASDHPHATRRPPDGIELPSGGLVAATLAAAVSAAIVIGRRRRSARRRSVDVPGTAPAESPLPAAARPLRRAHLDTGRASDADGNSGRTGEDVEAFVAPASDPPPIGAAVAGSLTTPLVSPTSAALGVLPVGIDDDRRTDIPLDLTSIPGVGFTGPVAVAVARHAAVTVLSAPGTDPGEVILAGPEATELIPDGIEAPGLTRLGRLEQALGRIEAEIVHRRRLADEATDLATLRAAVSDQPLPLILLITAVPDAATRRRLETDLTLGQQLGVTGLLLGAWPYGGTCTVADGGRISTETGQNLEPLDGARAYTLTASDAADMLAVLAESRGTTAEPDHPPVTRPPAAPVPPTQASPPARLYVLGPVRLFADGKGRGKNIAREIGIERRTARELAVYLATHPDGASVDSITEAIWPDHDPAKIVQRRKDAFKTLRQALREATNTATDPIRRTGDGHYQLRADITDVDLWRFHTALTDAARAATDDERRKALARAADAYTGDLATDAAYEWIEPIRETERRHAIDTLTRLAELQQPLSPETALASLEKAFTLDPYAEDVARHIMAIQAESGQLDAARRTYRILENRLSEIGIEPIDETMLYMRRISRIGDDRRRE